MMRSGTLAAVHNKQAARRARASTTRLGVSVFTRAPVQRNAESASTSYAGIRVTTSPTFSPSLPVSAALVLTCHARSQIRGLRTPLTIYPVVSRGVV